jgi:hypothetical protein
MKEIIDPGGVFFYPQCSQTCGSGGYQHGGISRACCHLAPTFSEKMMKTNSPGYLEVIENSSNRLYFKKYLAYSVRNEWRSDIIWHFF